MPWISRFLDHLTISATRGAFTDVSRMVRDSTGYWFHPAVWQMTVALVLVLAAYWFYVAIRPARA